MHITMSVIDGLEKSKQIEKLSFILSHQIA